MSPSVFKCLHDYLGLDLELFWHSIKVSRTFARLKYHSNQNQNFYGLAKFITKCVGDQLLR